MRWATRLAFVLASAALWWPAPSNAARIKEVASIQGVRANQLVGYGLVVGLDGTGEQNAVTAQSLTAMLQSLGVTLPPGVSPQGRNAAAVMVTAELPPFAQPGQPIDINVSSLGGAKSLRGGTLIMTPLRGADGEVYALAQGNLIVGGAGASAGGSKVQINHLSAGRIPGGATVERGVPTPLHEGDTRAARPARGRLQHRRRPWSRPSMRPRAPAPRRPWTAARCRCGCPPGAGARGLHGRRSRTCRCSWHKPAARVVINARTGSVVMNEAVTLGACAVAHGSLSVTISSTPLVSQPGALSGGQTVARASAPTSRSRSRAAR